MSASNSHVLFKNHLPIKIAIYISKTQPGFMVRDSDDFFVGNIDAWKILKTDILIEHGDVLKIVHPDNHNYRICFPFQLHTGLNHIDIGVIQYFNKSSGAGTVYANADISRLTFKNNLAMPINIIYRGNILAVLGHRKEITLSNDWFGFQMLDRINFTFQDGTPVGSAHLSDNFMTHIVIGCVSQKINQETINDLAKGAFERGETLRGIGVNKYHPNDIFSYRIAQPQIIGTQQFITDSRYNTIRIPGN